MGNDKEIFWSAISKDDLLFLGEAAGYQTSFIEEDEGSDADSLIPYEKDPTKIIKEISAKAISETPEDFCRFVTENKEEIWLAAVFDDDAIRALITGYKFGIGQKCGASANDLGTLYYMGELVEQDYAKAAELYELAIGWGCDQSIINMGYIYEYGRVGKPDYAKAFEYYSLGVALSDKSEAFYKLGDMYSRGKGVSKDLSKAAALWQKSLNRARGLVEVAQPAIRLAPLYLEGSEEAKIDKDALHALRLYQDAEIGLRIDIKNGQIYYKDRLVQAIEGQERARRVLDTLANFETAQLS
ncbi:tetratricopeptide repeat protein [Anaerotardibacter muris]|uniref:tetratricopeptide repeat protein n=1 Tax=Anaerotardibacter muris TaxID=2941505 RepID=UPI002040AA61|nr:tetratricopeptide repeat protein [Anaerotardibacter muris]